MSNRKVRLFRAAAILVVMSASFSSASAQRSRGGGGAGGRASSAGSHRSAGGGAHSQRATSASRHAGATHSGARGSSVNRNANVNRSANVNNVNVNRNVNVNGNGYGYGRGYHPVARAATVGAVAVTTGAIIGSTYHSLPSSCMTVVQAGATYHHCGSAWYQRHNGEYITVVAP